MKMIRAAKLINLFLKTSMMSFMIFGFSQTAFSMTFASWWMPSEIEARLATYTLDCWHWYAGGNIGASHLRDRPNPGLASSVNEYGPGASVQGGFQFNSIFGVELGYTYYKNSREILNPVVIAETDHYSIDLAGVVRYPLYYQWSALGKLGVAYSYARKMAIATGTAASANSTSVYWAAGFAYSITPKIDFIGQFAEAIGNHLTGSTDLWSIGLNFALV